MCIKCIKEGGGLFMPKPKIKPKEITDSSNENSQVHIIQIQAWMSDHFRESIVSLSTSYMYSQSQLFHMYLGHISNNDAFELRCGTTKLCIFVPNIDRKVSDYNFLLKQLNLNSNYDIWTFQHKIVCSFSESATLKLQESYANHIEQFLSNYHIFYPYLSTNKSVYPEICFIGSGTLGTFIANNVKHEYLLKSIVIDYRDSDSISQGKDQQHYIIESSTQSCATSSISLSDFIPIFEYDTPTYDSNLSRTSDNISFGNILRADAMISNLNLFVSYLRHITTYKTPSFGICENSVSLATPYKILRISLLRKEENISFASDFKGNTKELNINESHILQISQLEYLYNCIEMFLSKI